jgi:hypothetical protein
MLFHQLPNEIQQYIHDYVGEKEENMKKFSKDILPNIMVEITLRELKKFQTLYISNGNLLEFFKSEDPNRKNYFQFKYQTHIQYVEILIDNIHLEWAPLFRWYDFTWYSIDDFLQFVIHHWVDNNPFPTLDEFNAAQFINFLEPDELDELLDELIFR